MVSAKIFQKNDNVLFKLSTNISFRNVEPVKDVTGTSGMNIFTEFMVHL